ncbi:MAG: hypothetical protein M1371_06485 [Actinobacteria bacterium]|nr:hypothetical protein [Actinomycetota bacterium]
MVIPIFGSLPLTAWIGFLLIILIIFQILTGRRIIRLKLKWHRLNGYAIFIIGLIHGFLGLGVWLFGFRY